ncbi:MAG: carboxynorspermidine decarboxylase [Pseudomonadota bacterium]
MGSDKFLRSVESGKIQTPYFVVDQALIRRNLKIIDDVIKRTECKVVLALKAFSMYSTFGLLKKTLCGTCASSVNEARLGKEEFGGEVHVFSAAYSEKDLKELLELADHIDFNSFEQWKRFKPLALKAKEKKNIEFGLRINPEHSEGTTEIYDPCAKNSRLGITRKNFKPQELDGISYLHFHTLCEQNAEPLVRTLAAVEEKFGEFIPKMKYVNFGGGHHITREDYKVDLLVDTINKFKKKYNVQVYLEPGEAVVLNTGFLVSEVLDIIENGMQIAVLDTSAACHMPDVLEMPYRPFVINSGKSNEKKYTYRLGGMSCLAGDIIGDYSFDKPLNVGDKIIFTDMTHYSMVKTNTFNGLNLPTIAIYDTDADELKVIRSFGYKDFKERL